MDSLPGGKPWADDQSEAGSPPPYHEAAAYAAAAARPRRLRRVFSVPVGLALGLTVAISWLCFLVERATHHHHSGGASQHHHRLRVPPPSPAVARFEESLQRCAAVRTFPERSDPSTRRANPRWNPVSGQKETVVLRNATLFDGESVLPGRVDIALSRGLVVSVVPSSAGAAAVSGWAGREVDLHGAFVTPGLVDMHSHHLGLPFPVLDSDDDTNEVHPDYGPLTPFVSVLDGLSAYDKATAMIASGGVTSSLIIPGSANVMGGEGVVVKNRVRPGPAAEFVVEEMLLEHGIPPERRHRYMKMACGENPKRVYGHTRMGNAWLLRHHLAKAQELLRQQDAWCDAAAAVATAADREAFVRAEGGFPAELELDSTVGMLRGRVAMHNHCYTPNDLETMLRISKEFGFRVRAFHHAIAAWLVPEMLKQYGENVTIATFAEQSLYKVEAYQASLFAGMTLNDHGVPVAYKSDHSGDTTNAKYLAYQAAIARYFRLPVEKALAAVTSTPARAIDQDDRIGYVRQGFDADVVVWDAHPLSIGATPLQVFIDGVETLDPAKVADSMAPAKKVRGTWPEAGGSDGKDLGVRITLPKPTKDRFCRLAAAEDGKAFVISGIRRTLLENYAEQLAGFSDYTARGDASSNGDTLTLVLLNGAITCLDTEANCRGARASALRSGATSLRLTNGYLAPGLTAAVTDSLGMAEISLEAATADGMLSPALDPRNPENVPFARHGVALEGKGFVRARLGGVTRAVSAPLTAGGLVRGVSTGIRTGGKRSLLDGGVFRPDVALHVALGAANKVSPGSVSMAVATLGRILTANKGKGNESVYGLVADGKLPLVVEAESKYHIQQVVLLKREHPDVKFVIHGGQGAPFVADELAKAKIPVVLKPRAGPATWDSKDVLVGPPLTRSPASVLNEAGVLYAITVGDGPPTGDARIHDLAVEATWTAKYAGLSERETIRLVSRNVEDILGLEPSKDIVIWEGSPLAFGTPVLAFDSAGPGGLELTSCWPDEELDE